MDVVADEPVGPSSGRSRGRPKTRVLPTDQARPALSDETIMTAGEYAAQHGVPIGRAVDELVKLGTVIHTEDRLIRLIVDAAERTERNAAALLEDGERRLADAARLAENRLAATASNLARSVAESVASELSAAARTTIVDALKDDVIEAFMRRIRADADSHFSDTQGAISTLRRELTATIQDVASEVGAVATVLNQLPKRLDYPDAPTWSEAMDEVVAALMVTVRDQFQEAINRQARISQAQSAAVLEASKDIVEIETRIIHLTALVERHIIGIDNDPGQGG